jgi:hypothetical protein
MKRSKYPDPPLPLAINAQLHRVRTRLEPAEQRELEECLAVRRLYRRKEGFLNADPRIGERHAGSHT